VKRSRVIIGVSYDCTEKQLSLIPDLIEGLVNREPLASFRSCRLLAISAFSYDYVFDYRTNQSSFAGFLDELNRINRGIIQAFAAHQIDIPFPTNMEIRKVLDQNSIFGASGSGIDLVDSDNIGTKSKDRPMGSD
jgi:MscS family membrane protein